MPFANLHFRRMKMLPNGSSSSGASRRRACSFKLMPRTGPPLDALHQMLRAEA